jgi:hypothetical protein
MFRQFAQPQEIYFPALTSFFGFAHQNFPVRNGIGPKRKPPEDFCQIRAVSIRIRKNGAVRFIPPG